MFRSIVVASVLAASALPSPQPPQPPATAVAPDPNDPTTGPWSEQALDRAVAGPIQAGKRFGSGEGDRRFEALLEAVGPNPQERTRLLTAYALSLMTRTGGSARGLPYLKRAADEARLAWPSDSRQRAMALADYAQVEFEVMGDAVSPEAERAALDAYDVRFRTLGPAHEETRFSRDTLDRIAELPSRIRGDSERLAIASRRYEVLLDGRGEPWDRRVFISRWTAMLIANHRPDLACAVLLRLQTGPGRTSDSNLGRRVGSQLREAGYVREAAPLLVEDAGEATLASLEGISDGPPVKCGQ